MSDRGWRLFGRPGWGSAIVELQLGALGVPFVFDEVGDLFESAAARESLARWHPLAQIPTLLLPDGGVLTESAAITLHLADATGRDDFVPPVGHPARPPFLRWLVFLVANIYPTFTYRDDPERFVKDAAAAEGFATEVDEYRKRLWRIVEGAAGAPWFLGERLSALDLYVATMVHWRPRRDWFEAEAPKLAAIARRVAADARFAAVLKRNFPDAG